MELEQGLFAYLTTHPEVGPVIGTRCYPEKIPEHVRNEATKLACVVYQRVGGVRQVTTCGTDDLVEAIEQVDVYTRSYEDTKRLARLVRRALIDFSGDMGGVPVSATFLDGEMDLPDSDLERVMHTFRIWFTET